MIVLGCGTGRCGTKSLAEFLDKQPNSEVSHEFGQQLSWDGSDGDLFEKRISIWLADFNWNEAQLKGDVALWYLPYIENIVRKIQSISRFNNSYIPFKVVCLKRVREETIQSFIEHQNSGNTFQEKGGSWPEVDRAFPTYPNDLSQEEAISEYWKDYYETAEWLSDMVEWFRIFELEELSNSKLKRAELLDFLEFPLDKRRFIDFPHANLGS